MDIFPLVGIGCLRFGMTPSEVEEIYGRNQMYEDWMGGNLNDFMFYESLLIGFNGNNAEKPSSKSKITMFEHRCSERTRIFGKSIGYKTKCELVKLFIEHSASLVQGNYSFARVLAIGVQLNFGGDGRLFSIYLQDKKWAD